MSTQGDGHNRRRSKLVLKLGYLSGGLFRAAIERVQTDTWTVLDCVENLLSKHLVTPLKHGLE